MEPRIAVLTVGVDDATNLAHDSTIPTGMPSPTRSRWAQRADESGRGRGDGAGQLLPKR
jgi:hypothetical protein